MEKYDLEEKIYENQLSTIWKASKDEKEYAIKCVEIEEENKERTEREINLLTLIRHKNLINLYEAFVEDGKIYMVMDLAKDSIWGILKRNYPTGIDEKYISVILRQVLEGLKELHTHGVIHRDIKSPNILVSNNGNIKITDFGVSGILTDYEKKRTTFAGTVCWMAPEVMSQKSEGYDYSIDAWSLGITALELMFGNPPYVGLHAMKTVMKIMSNPPPDPKKIGKELGIDTSVIFRSFVNSCLKKDPSDRKSIKDLLNHRFIKKYNKLKPEIILDLFK